MKYWAKPHLPHVNNCTAELLEYVTKLGHTKVSLFWNEIDKDDLLREVPSFAEAIMLDGLGPIRMAVTVTSHLDSAPIHIDHTHGLQEGVQARLNIPLMNTLNSTTAFYDMTGIPHTSVTPWGTIAWARPWRDYKIPVSSTCVDTATVLRTSAPHALFCKGVDFPRVCLSVSFDTDVVRFLQ